MEKTKWELIRASKQTNDQLKLLAIISGLKVAEIIRNFAKIMTVISMKNQDNVFGYELQFKLKLSENSIIVKLKPKGDNS